MTTWLLVADDETWTNLLGAKVWMLSNRYKRMARRIKIGEDAIAYVKYFSGIYGIVKITSEVFRQNGTPYPIRFNIEPEIFLDEPVSIRPLIQSLSFIKNKKRWFAYFQTSLRRIPEKDFALVRGYLIRERQKISSR